MQSVRLHRLSGGPGKVADLRETNPCSVESPEQLKPVSNLSTPCAARRRNGSGAVEKKLRYSVNTSSARDDLRSGPLGCEHQRPLVSAIGGIRKSNPAERIGEKRRHTSLFGQP
jgi:hypothetical protein